MKRLFGNLLLVILATTLVNFPLNARAATICTRDKNSSVNLRVGPGTPYAKGLVMVGSGGAKIKEYFRKRNYKISAGEKVSVFETKLGTEGQSWSKVGTNQWVAWVRSEFVCSS